MSNPDLTNSWDEGGALASDWSSGNAQVLDTQALDTQAIGDVVGAGIQGVRFIKFMNSGVGLRGLDLGPVDVFTYKANAVELQFEVSPEVDKQYRDIKPVTYLGPDAKWGIYGNPLTAETWTKISGNPGEEYDKETPENVKRSGNIIALYDNPGLNMYPFKDPPRPSRIKLLQNFTTWIVGKPIRGGAQQKLSEVVAWYSVVSLFNTNWANEESLPDWMRMYENRSDIGWVDVNEMPDVEG